MKTSLCTILAVGLLGLTGFAQSSSERSPAARPQAGASTTTGATTAEDANISHKGKTDDKNAATQGVSQGTNASGSAQASGNSMAAEVASGASVPAVLSRSIDTKKAKLGDEVTAKTTDDLNGPAGLTIPKNSKLIGHVTEVKAYEKGASESRLGISFEKAVIKGGQEIPLHATLLALAPPVEVAMPPDISESSAQSSGAHTADQPSGGLAGGATRTAGTAVGAAADTAGGVASSANVGANSTVGAAGTAVPATLNANSRGVIGIRGVELSAATSTSAQGSVLMSRSSNVHLDSGTRMVVRISGQ